MYLALYDFGQDAAWAAPIATVPALGNGFVQLGYLLDPITGLLGGGGGAGEEQTTGTQQGLGATADKKQRRKDLTEATLAVAGPLSALGSALGDNEMVAIADITASKLQTMRDGLLGSRARSIHAVATAHAAALVANGVTSVERNALAAAITGWIARVQRPRQRKAFAKAQAVVIEKSLQALDVFVKTQLDKLMLPFKAKAPSFHAAYQASRVIHDNPGGSGSPPAPPPGP